MHFFFQMFIVVMNLNSYFKVYVYFLYHAINAHINPLPEAFGNVTSILAGNLGEVFSVART